MSNLVLVAFNEDEGRTCGDSSLQSHFTIDQVNGEKWDDTLHRYLHMMAVDYDELDHYETVEDFADEYGLEVSGFWLVDETFHSQVTTPSPDLDHDLALYARIEALYASAKTVKTILEANARFTIIRPDK